MDAFVRNYKDESTEAGFQFTFLCDNCHDGFMSDFIESTTYKKGSFIKGVTSGAGILGNFVGGALDRAGWASERAGSLLGDRFSDASPEWRREYERAFEKAQHDIIGHFHRCPSCASYVCQSCWNEDTGLCIHCSPRQEVYVAKAHAGAMTRNIDAAAANATVWQGEIEVKTTICPSCGKPAGSGKFCNSCGASLALIECPKCGAQNAQTVKFCNNCGTPLAEPIAAATPLQTGICPTCGAQNNPGTKFCGECGSGLT